MKQKVHLHISGPRSGHIASASSSLCINNWTQVSNSSALCQKPLLSPFTYLPSRRPSMEDAHCVVADMNRAFRLQSALPQAFFGLFDGKLS